MPARHGGDYSVPLHPAATPQASPQRGPYTVLMVLPAVSYVPLPAAPRPDICTSSQYQSYLNCNWASRVATNVSICAGPTIGGGGADGRWGSGGAGRLAAGRRSMGAALGEMIRDCLALLAGWQSRPLERRGRKSGRETPGSRSVANLDRSRIHGGNPPRNHRGSPTENPTEKKGSPAAAPAGAMNCSRDVRLLLRRLLLDELLNGLLGLNGLGAGIHPAFLDGLEEGGLIGEVVHALAIEPGRSTSSGRVVTSSEQSTKRPFSFSCSQSCTRQ